MKNKLFKAACFILLSIFAACSTGDSPSDVAELFLKDVNSMKFDEAKKYSTEETAKMLEMMANLMAMSPTNKFPEKKITILDEVINGNSAKVKYEQEGKGIEYIKLVKKDDKWLVSVSKEDMAAKNAKKVKEDKEFKSVDSSATSLPDTTNK